MSDLDDTQPHVTPVPPVTPNVLSTPGQPDAGAASGPTPAPGDATGSWGTGTPPTATPAGATPPPGPPPPPAAPPPSTSAPPLQAVPPPATPSAWREPPWVPPREQSRGPSSVAIVVGLIILAAGLYFFIDRTLGIDLPVIHWGSLWPILLVIVGGLIVVRALDRSR